MKTLKEIIAEGLPVGALVTHIHYRIKMQLHTDLRWYVLKQEKYLASESIYHVLESWQPTTAYDSQIDPETLPIVEPFWTGWVVVDRMKDWVRFPVLRYHYSGDLMTEIECSDKMNSKLSPTDCQPCLPPA